MMIKVIRLLSLLLMAGVLVTLQEKPVQAAICCDNCMGMEIYYMGVCPDGPSQSDFCARMLNEVVPRCWRMCNLSSCSPNHEACTWIEVGSNQWQFYCFP